jgi:hypothetical protein
MKIIVGGFRQTYALGAGSFVFNSQRTRHVGNRNSSRSSPHTQTGRSGNPKFLSSPAKKVKPRVMKSSLVHRPSCPIICPWQLEELGIVIPDENMTPRKFMTHTIGLEGRLSLGEPLLYALNEPSYLIEANSSQPAELAGTEELANDTNNIGYYQKTPCQLRLKQALSTGELLKNYSNGNSVERAISRAITSYTISQGDVFLSDLLGMGSTSINGVDKGFGLSRILNSLSTDLAFSGTYATWCSAAGKVRSSLLTLEDTMSILQLPNSDPNRLAKGSIKEFYDALAKLYAACFVDLCNSGNLNTGQYANIPQSHFTSCVVVSNPFVEELFREKDRRLLINITFRDRLEVYYKYANDVTRNCFVVVGNSTAQAEEPPVS